MLHELKNPIYLYVVYNNYCNYKKYVLNYSDSKLRFYISKDEQFPSFSINELNYYGASCDKDIAFIRFYNKNKNKIDIQLKAINVYDMIINKRPELFI